MIIEGDMLLFETRFQGKKVVEIRQRKDYQGLCQGC